MRVYKITFFIALIVAIVALLFSIGLQFGCSIWASWGCNVCLGIFSSSFLVFISALIGYIVEEKRSYLEYYWKLDRLKYKAFDLSTIPLSTDIKEYWQAIVSINELLSAYFAICEQEYILPKRKKIQKLLEIQTALCEYKDLSLAAELYFRRYICNKRAITGEQEYTKEQLVLDTKNYCKATDSFMDTGEPFACYLDKKTKEMVVYLSANEKLKETHNEQV